MEERSWAEGKSGKMAHGGAGTILNKTVLSFAEKGLPHLDRVERGRERRSLSRLSEKGKVRFFLSLGGKSGSPRIRHPIYEANNKKEG